MAKVTDPDLLAQGVEIIFDTTAKTIEVIATGDISDTGAQSDNGVTLQCLYSFCKEERRTDTTLIKFPFPFESITPEQFELRNGWNFKDTSSRNLIRDGGWAVVDASTGNNNEERMNLTTLGSFDAGTDQAYYQQETAGATTDIVLAGEVNQAVQIYSDPNGDGSVADGYDRRDYFKIFLREQGKLYASYDLIIEQGLSTLTFKKFALPLSNGSDLKITAADIAIDANADGTADVAPYDDMDITYLVGNNFYTTNVGTVVTDDVIQDGNGRRFICTSGGTIDATDYADMSVMAGAGSAAIIAFPGERQIGANYYAYNVIIDADVADNGSEPSKEEIYEFVQWSLRQTVDIDAGSGSVIGEVADDLLAFVGDQLVTESGVYIDDFNANDTNSITFTDVSGAGQNFPFVATGTIFFNDNLQNDSNAKYWVFFTNDDSGDNAGNDFDTSGALLIDDNSDTDITGDVTGASSKAFDFDYDGNVQRGAASAGTDAPFTAVALGLDTAKYVITTGTITRSEANAINYVAALERNYLNPA